MESGRLTSAVHCSGRFFTSHTSLLALSLKVSRQCGPIVRRCVGFFTGGSEARGFCSLRVRGFGEDAVRITLVDILYGSGATSFRRILHSVLASSNLRSGGCLTRFRGCSLLSTF